MRGRSRAVVRSYVTDVAVLSRPFADKVFVVRRKSSLE